jgi:ABC-type multidrug transport system fused ATPase/permease subunit
MTEGITQFVITHRICALRDCERIILLCDHHRPVVGTHRELIRQNDYYREMAVLQQPCAAGDWVFVN